MRANAGIAAACLALAGLVGIAGVAAAASASAANANGSAAPEPVTSASLAAFDRDSAHHLLTQDYVARARRNLSRAGELRASGDATRAEIAEKSAAIWQEAARTLVRAAEGEERASTVQMDALDAGTRAERERALLEESLATVGRRRAELARLEREKNEAPTRTTQTARTADVHSSSGGGSLDGADGGAATTGTRGGKGAIKDAGAEKDWTPNAATAPAVTAVNAGRTSPIVFAIAASAFAFGTAGCGASTTPPAYSELEASRGAPVARESAALAPEAFAEAEHQRALAERTYRDGDDETAGLDAERALAGYALVESIAREKRAHDREAVAIAGRTAEQDRANKTIADRTRADADAAELDSELKVAAHPANPRASGPVAKDRENARLRAAASLATEGAELCTAAATVGGKPVDPAMTTEGNDVATLIGTPAKSAGPAIDAAARHRAHCLNALAVARGRDASAEADALLVRVAQEAGLSPYRTEIGVAVTIESPFDQGDIKEAARATIAKLAAIAVEKNAPMLFVTHDAGKSGNSGSATDDTKRDQDRGAAAVRIAKDGRASLAATSMSAGITVDIVDPSDKANNARNERLDIVLIAHGVATR